MHISHQVHGRTTLDQAEVRYIRTKSKVECAEWKFLNVHTYQYVILSKPHHHPLSPFLLRVRGTVTLIATLPDKALVDELLSSSYF